MGFSDKMKELSNAFTLLKYKKENKIFTHLTNDEKLKLVELSRKCKGNIFVEIGSYLGASSCFIANGINKSRKNARLYCIDTWGNNAMTEGKKETFSVFIENTRKYQDIIIPLRGISVEVAKAFKDKIDFLFIDGDHSYEGVRADVDSWFPKLNKNAIVVFHDIEWAEGVQRVVSEDITPKAKKQGRLPNLYWAWYKE